MIGNLLWGLNGVIPLFIICLCYFGVFIAIRKNYFRVEEALLASVKIMEVRITKTVFAVLVGFLFCWIPAMVCNYLSFNMVNPRFPRQGDRFSLFFSASARQLTQLFMEQLLDPSERTFFILFVAEKLRL